MNKDIRISTGLFDHPKTKKLIRRLGEAGFIALLKLWIFAAKERPGGDLSGMDHEDIELAADWSGDADVFVSTLVELRWLDGEGGKYSLHDWAENNGWAAKADDRADKARFSRLAKTHPEVYAEMKARSVNAISTEQYAALTTVERPLTSGTTPAPAPAPAPAPSPKDRESVQGDFPSIPYEEIRLAFNKFCPSFPPVHQITSTRFAAIRKFWNKYESHEGGAKRVLDALFKKAEASDWLAGRTQKGRWCKFDWIIDVDNAVTIIEGQHDNPIPHKPQHDSHSYHIDTIMKGVKM